MNFLSKEQQEQLEALAETFKASYWVMDRIAKSLASIEESLKAIAEKK